MNTMNTINTTARRRHFHFTVSPQVQSTSGASVTWGLPTLLKLSTARTWTKWNEVSWETACQPRKFP
eukprot:2188113-Amphidinium_carterae.1